MGCLDPDFLRWDPGRRYLLNDRHGPIGLGNVSFGSSGWRKGGRETRYEEWTSLVSRSLSLTLSIHLKTLGNHQFKSSVTTRYLSFSLPEPNLKSRWLKIDTSLIGRIRNEGKDTEPQVPTGCHTMFLFVSIILHRGSFTIEVVTNLTVIVGISMNFSL